MSICTTDEYGTKVWRQNGVIHRENGPAIVWQDGAKFWYVHGIKHREDGPANEYANGLKEWFLNGQRHRGDGPAVVHSDGTQLWWLHGLRHREDGPACISPYDENWRNMHTKRLISARGTKDWWVNGVKLDGRALLQHQQSFLSHIVISALLPLDLPLYVLLEILQFAYPFISELDERAIVRFLQGARASADQIKLDL